MAFNPTKCSLIFFGKTHFNLDTIKYNLCNTTLTITDIIKYLGIHINNSLKWEKHINSTITKATKILGYINSTLHNAPEKVKILAYLTLAKPVLEYSSEVWDPNYLKKIYTN